LQSREEKIATPAEKAQAPIPGIKFFRLVAPLEEKESSRVRIHAPKNGFSQCKHTRLA